MRSSPRASIGLIMLAGVDRAFRSARADDRVQLVDEGDDLAVAVDDLLEDGLEPVLELAAVLRAGHHRADVERDQALVPQPLGHVTLDDAPGEALGDRGLADPRLADEHRVVLRAARQHLDHSPDLLVAPDDGVELAFARVLREIATEPLERLVLLLGVLAGDPVAAAHLLERAEHGFVGDTESAEEIADATGHARHRQEEVLGGEVVVAEVGALGVGGLEHLIGVRRELGLLGGLPVDLGQTGQGLVRAVADRLGGHADPLEHRQHDALGLADQRGEQVLGCDLRVVPFAGERLRGAERLAGLAGQLVGVERHTFTFARSGRRDPPEAGVPKVDNLTINFIPATVFRSGQGRARARPPISETGPLEIARRGSPATR